MGPERPRQGYDPLVHPVNQAHEAGGPVRRVGPDDAEVLSRFFRKVWNPGSTPASVKRAREEAAKANPVDPGTPPPTFIFLKDGEAIGYVTTLPARFRIGAAERPGYWLKGLSVLPEFRSGPVGFHLVKRAADEVELLASLAVAQPARRLLEAVGFRDVIVPANFLWPLRPGRVARNLAPEGFPATGRPRWLAGLWRVLRGAGLGGPLGALGGGALRLRRSRRQAGYRGRIEAGWTSGSGAAMDDLWSRRAGPHYQGVVRDSAYLYRRYRGSDDEEYVPLLAMSEASPEALVMVRRPREVHQGRFQGLRIGWVTEILSDPGLPQSARAATALIRAGESLCRDEDGDLVLASFSGRSEIEIMRRTGHLETQGTMHLLFKGIDEAASGGDPHREWVVSRGDGDSDAVS